MAAGLAFKISPENRMGDFGDFESWSNGTSVAPDGWAATGTAGSIARESTEIKWGVYAMRIISGASATYAAQYIYDLIAAPAIFHNGQDVSALNFFPGRTVKFGMWVKCSTASKARIWIDDGITARTNSSYHTGGGSYEFIEVSQQIHANATQIKFGCEVAATSITAYFDSGIFVEGELIWTDFRGSNIWVKEQDFDPQVTFSVGSFEMARRQGTKITDVTMVQRRIRISVQIHNTSLALARAAFDTIVKAVCNGRKDIWFEDDRVSKVYLTNFPRLQFLAAAQVYLFDLQFTAEEPFLNYVAKYRQKNNISASPTSFSVAVNGSLFTYPTFRFIPPAGITISSLTLENLSTGERFSYAGTIGPALTMMLDCENIKLTVNNVDGLTFLAGDFLQLRPGTNNLKFTGTAGITILTDWFDRYL